MIRRIEGGWRRDKIKAREGSTKKRRLRRTLIIAISIAIPCVITLIIAPDILNVRAYPNQVAATWQVEWGGADVYQLGGLARSSTGDVFCTFSIYDETRFGSDVEVCKMNANRMIEWNVTWTNTTWDSAKSVAVDDAGNAFVATCSGGITTLLKFNASGALQWSRVKSDGSDNVGEAVVIDEGGNSFFAGYTCQSFETYNSFIRKYYTNGTLAWEIIWNAGVTSNDLCTCIAVDQEENCYFGGYMGPNVEYANDIFLVKLNATGSEIWTRIWHRPTLVQCLAIGVDPAGNVVQLIGPFSNPYMKGHIEFAKYNSNGDFLWNSSWSTIADAEFCCVAINGSGDIVLGSYAFNNGTRQDNTILGTFDENGQLVREEYVGPEWGYAPAAIIIDDNGNRIILGGIAFLTLISPNPNIILNPRAVFSQFLQVLCAGVLGVIGIGSIVIARRFAGVPPPPTEKVDLSQRRCPVCGAVLLDQARYCHMCREPLSL